MKDKFKLVMITAITVLLAINIGLFVVAKKDLIEVGFYEITMFVVPVIIVVVMLFMIKKRREALKLGEPFEDERDKEIKQKAASRSYFISLYVWILLMFLSDLFESVSTLIGVGIVVMSLLFIFQMLFMSRSPK